MAQAFFPCIASLPQPSNWDCSQRAGKTCLWGFCDYCCVNSGYQLLYMCPCPSPNHRIRPNNEPYFAPNHSVFYKRTHTSSIRIVSPLTGNLECAAGSAWSNLVAGDWKEVQELLREQAEYRLIPEGITVFLCIWSQEDSAPAIYIRVIRSGRAWSLGDDRGLLEQMDWIPGQAVGRVFKSWEWLWESLMDIVNRLLCNTHLKICPQAVTGAQQTRRLAMTSGMMNPARPYAAAETPKRMQQQSSATYMKPKPALAPESTRAKARQAVGRVLKS
ncbi:hypothetical protein M407DRAFT_31344 [Tulasnella calospora MUT 4182]|uniref:Uncharacterized protein n=1 Tax=Tulasnella calospora MUT 4182 TaxID=1051891 RepID=A0A0C3PVJ9_9AGAM|nr:hypothetical protein M407DRAFT_31344 [Tulasnella calospora MUT 4182]